MHHNKMAAGKLFFQLNGEERRWAGLAEIGDKGNAQSNIRQIQKQIKTVRTGLGIGADVTVIPFSAETKQGREEIWTLIEHLTEPEQEMEEAADERGMAESGE